MMFRLVFIFIVSTWWWFTSDLITIQGIIEFRNSFVVGL